MKKLTKKRKTDTIYIYIYKQIVESYIFSLKLIYDMLS